MHKTLQERSNHACELCTSTESIESYVVPPKTNESLDHQVVLCKSCLAQISKDDFSDSNYFRFLSGTIWSEVPAIQVLSYKLLHKFKDLNWAQDALDNAYLEEELIIWAKAEDEAEANKVIHKDAYGTELTSGDTILLTQNLNVKGTNFIAPKGTKVTKIRLVYDNDEQIEGKVNGSTIIILTKYVKKA